MNTKIADKAFRFLFITAFVLGLIWTPGISARAQDPLPSFTVYYNADSIHGGNWPLGTSVTLTIDDPTTPQNPDLIETKTVTMHPDGYTQVPFDSLLLDIKPGFYVSMTGDGITKETTVIDIGQVSYDVDTDIVSGVSTPNTELQIGADWGSWRNVVTGADGSWSADFSILGDVIGHNQIVDIKPGTSLFVQQSDSDGDQSNYDWRVLDPSLYVFLSQLHRDPYDGLTSDPQGYAWPVGLPVTMTIDRPGTPQSPDFTIPGGSGEPDPRGGMHYWFDTSGILLYPGDIITVTNGEITITQVMSELAVMEINPNTDQVSGTAEPGKTVTVTLRNPWMERHVVTEPDGTWITDFSVPGDEPDEQEVANLVPGSVFFIGDGSANVYSIQINNPFITAYPAENIVKGEDFLQDADVTLTIDDPINGIGTDLTLQGLTDQTGGRCTGWCVEFSLPEEFHLASGQLITLTGSNTGIISYIVSSLTVDNVDILTDTVSGKAAPLSTVDVVLWFVDAQRRVTADEDGNWSADFSVPGVDPFDTGLCDFGVNPDCAGMALQSVGSGRTRVDWYAPVPAIAVHPEEDAIAGWWGAPLGTPINFSVDDPATPENPDYEGSTTVGEQNPDDHSFLVYLNGVIDIKPGFEITVSDGTTTKSAIVTNMQITAIDSVFDTITGTAETGSIVISQACGVGGCNWDGNDVTRTVVTDPEGNWVADYSVEGDSGEPVFDIVVGGEVWHTQEDEDGDTTRIQRPVPYPYCEPGDSVSGTVFAHDGVTPIPSSTVQFEDYTTGDILSLTTTNANGQYACQIPDGDYRIQALTDNYSSEYYNEAVDVTASRLQITSGTQLTGVNFTIAPLPFIEHFTFNLDNSLLQDRVVREAIALGTDRQRILNEAFLPNGIYGNISNSMVPPEHWVSAPLLELELHLFNPAQARLILETSGWIDRDSDGFSENAGGVELAFVFKTSNSAFRQASSEIFRQNMEDIGIRITVQLYPGGEFFGTGGILESRDFDIAEFAWAGGFDNEPYLNLYFTGNAQNFPGYSNPVYDAALTNARATAGDAAKLPYLYEAQNILSHDLPIIPLFTRYSITPTSTPTGTNVEVSVDTYLTVRFDNVTQEGVTAVFVNPSSPSNPPSNFEFIGSVYEVGTSAVFSGNAQVCFTYDDSGLTTVQEEAIRLFHSEGGLWLDVTDNGYPDIINNVACGTVSSFSPFILLYQLPPVAFAKVGPSNSAVNQNISLTISWNASEYATGYQYCIYKAGNPVCADNAWSDNGTATSKVITGLSYNTIYYWQVRAVNAGGKTLANSTTTFWSFKTKSKPLTVLSTATQDGWILESSENSNAGGTMNASATTFKLGDGTGDKQYRSILSFNTASLPDTAVITKVTLKIRVYGALVGNNNPFTWGQGLKVDVCKGTFGTSALQLTDFNFNNATNCRLLAGTFGSTPTSGWYSVNLISAARSKVNPLGLTQFRLRFYKDDNDDNAADYWRFFSGNYANVNLRPTLIIEYYVP